MINHTSKIQFGTTLVLFLVMSGCGSSPDVKTEYDHSVNFQDFQTFNWVDQPAAPGDSEQNSPATDPEIVQMVRQAVETQLQGKGLRLKTDTPDLLAVYHLGVEDAVEVTDWGYTEDENLRGSWDREIDEYEYQQGTLIIDLVDSQSKVLVWRGMAQDAVKDEKDRTRESASKKIDEVVKKIFAQFPPK